MPVIEVRDLVRTFRSTKGLLRRSGREVEAVRGISFDVERGELFGLLGPNGAGKTTTIKMLITLLLPDVRAGERARARRGRPTRARSAAGSATSSAATAASTSGCPDWTTCGTSPSCTRCPAREQRGRIGELLELVGLTGREQERVEGYSRGMRQRLHIARGLLHRPEVLFLDEPSIGIDPVGARELRATVKALVEQGTTVLLTTHYMFEADELCDRIAVIAGGAIVAERHAGGPQAARQPRATSSRWRSSASPTAWSTACSALPGVRPVVVEERGQAQVLLVHAEPGAEVTQPVLGLPGRRPGRPGRDPRADPGGRLRRAGARRVTRAAAGRRGLVAAAEDPQPVGLRRSARPALAAVLRHHDLPDVPGRRRSDGRAARARPSARA